MIEEKTNFECNIIENESPEKHGLFKIKNIITNQEKIIDDNFLSKTIYIDSLKIFNYGPERVDISNGHILLTYGIGAGNGYSHLIFEYNFEDETLEYKCLAFLEACQPVEIVYFG